jgi:carboxyl-terminal processing protease
VEAAGIRIGDIITHLDHASIRGLTITQVVEKMRGPVNSKVVVTVERGGPAGSVEVSATRDLIRVMTVHAGLEGGDVGYIQIAKFNGQTFEGLKSAVDRLSAQISSTKLKGYIIDLRNNPGGLVNQAVLVANAFVQGEVVSTRGRDSEMHRLGVDSGPRDMARGKPIIVLINGGSASAAEIVAGALQDHKRATILGTRSFGKGSVQTVTPLGKEAGALKLTTAWYVTPAGRFIQARGIAPDIEVAQDVPANASTRPDFGSEAALRGHLPVAGEGQEQDGSQSYVPQDRKKDKALTTALELLRGSQLHPAFPPKREASR